MYNVQRSAYSCLPPGMKLTMVAFEECLLCEGSEAASFI